MRPTCPSCGAAFTDGNSCDDRFNELLALEFTDSTYFAVHHLMVPAFMLQHNRYGHDGWLAARSLLKAFLAEGTDPREAERRMARRWASVTRGAPFDRFDEIRWSRTIADVRTDDADAYRRDVEAWAGSAVTDTERVATSE